jgi:hypothetical protein
MSEAKTLKVDRTKLRTITNYAKMMGVTTTTITNWIKSGMLQTEEIDGVRFIKIP